MAMSVTLKMIIYCLYAKLKLLFCHCIFSPVKSDSSGLRDSPSLFCKYSVHLKVLSEYVLFSLSVTVS